MPWNRAGGIFLDDADRDRFSERLAALFPETSTSCFARALIPDHSKLHRELRGGKMIPAFFI
jgi:hypothetical protein